MKDLFDTAGLETTYGSAVFAGHVPRQTATAVRLLEEAGYANVGKANLHEFAYGTTSENPHFGDVPNPRFPGRVAGGSSGGSAAAVAAGLADVGLGTDSAGSIRIPAACCGVVGHKPTHGLVSLDGCWPLAASFDTAGPIAADVEACERMLHVLAPAFERVELESLEQLEVGVAWTELADPLVRERVEAAAARFPRRRAVELPLVPAETYAVFMREAADVHRELYAENADLYGEDVRLKLEKCFAVRDAEVERAERLRREYREQAEACSRRARPRADADAPDRAAAARPRRRARRSGRARSTDPLHLSLLLARLAGARAAVRHCGGRSPGVAPDRGPRGRRRARPRRRRVAITPLRDGRGRLPAEDGKRCVSLVSSFSALSRSPSPDRCRRASPRLRPRRRA